MPATTSPTASTKVFANYDLLEDILLHLPIRDLLLSKRVCQQWSGMQDTSSRVRKALFIEPFHAQKIYYPSASKQHWYLVPTPAECAQEGLFDDDDDSVTTPQEFNLTVSDPAAPTPDESNIPSSSSSNSSDGSDVTVCNLEQDKHYMRGTASAKKAPKDHKMLVSRITTGPFLNPFTELFLQRFFRSARGTYQERPDYTRETMLVRPRRYADGTIHGSSHRTHAVERFTASWRRMAPFSAATTSIQVECFDFGFLDLYEDAGLTAGSLMEQLGEHWGSECPDCCIFDFWFAEFVLPCCYTDQSYMNRGEHGVRKLGLDNTGWDALCKMYELDNVSLTGIKDRQRPY